MIRIAGVDLPEHKKVAYSLTSIYGVGLELSNQILQEANVDANKRTRDLTNDEINRIQRSLEQHPTEGDLRRIVNDNIDRLKRVKA